MKMVILQARMLTHNGNFQDLFGGFDVYLRGLARSGEHLILDSAVAEHPVYLSDTPCNEPQEFQDADEKALFHMIVDMTDKAVVSTNIRPEQVEKRLAEARRVIPDHDYIVVTQERYL